MKGAVWWETITYSFVAELWILRNTSTVSRLKNSLIIGMFNTNFIEIMRWTTQDRISVLRQTIDDGSYMW